MNKEAEEGKGEIERSGGIGNENKRKKGCRRPKVKNHKGIDR